MNDHETKENASSNGRARISADAVVALLLALANLAVLFSCWQTVGVQADESMNIYGALRMLEGERIYRDFWVYNTPGIFALTAAVFFVFGKSLFAIRVVLILAASATASGLFLLGRKFMGVLPSALASLLFIMAGVNLWPVAGYHWYSTMALVFGLLFVSRFLEDRSRKKSLFAGGFLAAMVFMFQQPKGGYLLCLLSLFLVVDELLQEGESPPIARLLRTGAIFAGGAGTPILVVALYFALAGTFHEAVSATIIFPIKLLSSTGGEAGYAGFYGALTEHVLAQIANQSSVLGNGAWAVSVEVFLINYAAPFSIFLALCLWLIVRLRGGKESAIPVACSAGALAALGSALQKPDFFHLLTVQAPCYLTLAYTFHCIAGPGRNGKFLAVRKTAAVVLAAVVVLSCARILAAELSYASRIRPVSLGSSLGFIPAPEEKADAVAAGHPLVGVIEFIQLNTAPDEKVFAMSFSPFIYYLSGRQNPTPYLDIPSSPCVEGAKFHVFKLGHASFNLERLENAARALDADKTRFVILDPAAACQVRTGPDERIFESEPLIDYVREHYSIEADFGAYVVMRRTG